MEALSGQFACRLDGSDRLYKKNAKIIVKMENARDNINIL